MSTSGDEQTAALRRVHFLHQDGYVLSNVLWALEGRQLLPLLQTDTWSPVEALARDTHSREGPLHLALRCLAAQGWLERQGTPGTSSLSYRVTALGAAQRPLWPLYVETAASVASWGALSHALLRPDGALLASLGRLAEQAAAREANPEQTPELCRHHLGGALVVPLYLGLQKLGQLDEAGAQAVSSALAAPVRTFFQALGWLEPRATRWSSLGQEAFRYARHYGMVGSYWPMFRTLPEMLSGALNPQTHLATGSVEQHVDRQLNVLASGTAHQRYFRDADEIFIDLFNREPLEQQPAFVADMGCGDGSWLRHIYEVVRDQTLRGRQLQRYPLTMVGADYNEAALEVTQATLQQAGVPSVTLFADITDPARFARDLSRRGLQAGAGLHIRSFIDHNRRYQQPSDEPMERRDLSTGAYIDSGGEPVPNDWLEADLQGYLQRWTPYAQQHGLVILEAHCVDPQVCSQHLGLLPNLTFDTYHGFSKQYVVDFEVFMRAASNAGLESVLSQQRRYPSAMPFVAISLNRFLARAPPGNPSWQTGGRKAMPGDWSPADPDLEGDGEALHQLLYQGGDLTRPRPWCSNATGLLVQRALTEVRACIERLREQPGGDRSLCIVDYGTGTGSMVMELLKALEETGLLAQLATLQIALDLRLLDLPSGWFAMGYQLLAPCPFVRFHSLRGPGGEFVPVEQLVGAQRADLLLANMVFHLIPGAALGRVMKDLAQVLKPGGRLLWNTPDLGPTLPGSQLYHAPTRLLRRRLLEALEQPALVDQVLGQISSGDRQPYRRLEQEFAQVAARLRAEGYAQAAARANRQILPTPHTRQEVEAALAPVFEGETFVRTFEIRARDSLQSILVPANQKYLGELLDPELRRQFATLFMLWDVFPALRRGLCRTAYGYNLHWTFGDYRRRA